MTAPIDASSSSSSAAAPAATVLVPIVPLNGAPPSVDLPLYRLVAGDHPVSPARGKGDRQPQIEALHDFGAYVAGIKACAAVRALGLRRPWSWRPGRLVWPCVSVANFEPGRGSPLTKDTCHSAELGIALALVLGLTRRGRGGGPGGGAVVATGALGEPDSGAHDVPVLPVGCLDTKFALILKQIEAGAVGRSGWLFTPHLTPAGEPVAEAHAAVLKAIADTGVRVRHITGLRQAVEALGATDIPAEPPPPWLRTARKLAAGGALAATLAGAVWLVGDAHARRPLALAAVADPVSGLATPLRARHLSDGAFAALPPCRVGVERRDGVRAGESLLLRVDAGGEDPAGLDTAVVVVSADTGVKLFPKAIVSAVVNGGLNYAVPILEPAEPGLVVVLARRTGPFDGEAVGRGLREAIRDLAPTERLNAAANFLRPLAPGYLAIPIETLKADDPVCANG